LFLCTIKGKGLISKNCKRHCISNLFSVILLRAHWPQQEEGSESRHMHGSQWRCKLWGINIFILIFQTFLRPLQKESNGFEEFR
jgi:hypothetical protein